ncbi:DUF885 domain-containing protein [Aliiglaciecola sp. 3_MG-2023]|uniref:DUF885 domain-containing protein n=1 Tax=Aliiglaciecola sp. 3_MG-2023 TaxID=3062644 RepID=UPI0026E3EDBE|nr:DUF885 domain-containing protein [Aliiglaciecola sp. 3_MG-2023]MDO6694202.1 DUF885 domain-containing protein [Aliiglaciecola sp. 3_MG-2023]
MRINIILSMAFTVLVLTACAGHKVKTEDLNKPKNTAISSNVDAHQQLQQIFDDEWQYFLDTSPAYASYLGLGNDQQNSRWQDMSLSAIKAEDTHNRNVLKKLTTIDLKALSPSEQTNYQLFKWQLEMAIDEHQFKSYLIPIDQSQGIQTLDDMANFIPLATVADYENWLTRLTKIPTLISQSQKLMEVGISEGVMPSRDTMLRIPAQIQKQLVDAPEESLFYQPFANISDTISVAEQKRLQQQAASVIGEKIIPAFYEFNQFFVNKYLPATRTSHGLWDTPNGKAAYEQKVRYFTTTDLTPDEIHQIGLDEVARNRAEMDKVIEEVGFDGTFEEFITFLRTDPQFYYETPEELFDAYLAISKRIDPELVKLFGKLPRMPYGLKAIPDAVAPDSTTAYYNTPAADGSRAGYYYVNLYQPETRPKYEMEVLSVHEAVPGHHLQLALQMELDDMPNFRRFLGFTVFVEGWGLYSERLGYDLGLYKDPYSRFGQLTYDMWRSIRLVVDTGIHYKGWTRQQAIDYFKANAAKSEEDIINEIDRYISWPGQALAYKIGQLKMLELRERAKSKLGDKFDIKAFHDTLLGSGSIPLSVLEENIDNWIESVKSSK